jgi:hypothetical protein
VKVRASKLGMEQVRGRLNSLAEAESESYSIYDFLRAKCHRRVRWLGESQWFVMA